MSTYLTKFENNAAYSAFIATDYVKPNVSYIVEGNEVQYNPIVPLETRLVCKYNVASTSSPTALRSNYEQNIFKSMEIDGVMLDGLVTEYTFDSVGVHTVKYELYDETKLGNKSPVFYNGNLIEATIPNSVTTIGNNAFHSCSGLKSITIPSGVTSIGESVFYNCWGLTSITIPSGVTSIGNSAFFCCSGLTSITSLATTAPTIEFSTFQGVETGGTLYVPQGSDYNYWMATFRYHLGYYSWTKVEQ